MLRQPAVITELARWLSLDVPTRQVPKQRHKACRANGRLFTYGEVSPGAGETGSAEPTVVLVHGWGLGHHSYRRAAESLAARGFRVIVPDLPGSGWTGDLP